MSQLFLPRKHLLSSSNLPICNLELIRLKQTLSQKRKQRLHTQQQKKGMSNKLERLKDKEKIVVKQIEEKYGMLKSIFKVRMRKQSQVDARERNRVRKELVFRRTSADDCLQSSNNKKSLSLQNTISFKVLNKIYNLQLNKQQNKDKLNTKNNLKEYENKKKQQRKQLGNKILNSHNQYIDEFKIKLKQEQSKKKRNMEKIRKMSRNQSRKKVSIQNQELSKLKLDNLIKRAHSVSLIVLESQIKMREEVKDNINGKRKSMSKLSQKAKCNRKKVGESMMKTEKSAVINQETGSKNMFPNRSVSDIENTIRIIEQLEASHIKNTN